MKKILFNVIIVLLGFLILTSCSDKDDIVPPSIKECTTTTQYYGKMILNNELLCWSDTDQFTVSSAGSGNCGEGYEYVEHPFMSIGLILTEHNMNGEHKRSISISVPFTCNDFSTQEKFYDLLSKGLYSFSDSSNDYGRFIIEYRSEGRTYTSLNVDNSEFKVEILNIEKIKPEFYAEPNGNNGLPASIEIKLKFTCLLSDEAGNKIKLSEAELLGRTYRQSPWGYYWEDWGKGWNE